MATVSSHTLNGVDGTHAGGIAVTLVCCHGDGTATAVFSSRTDEGGRLSEDAATGEFSPDATYEMVFETGPYWEHRGNPGGSAQILRQIVVRFSMPDPEGRYHIPVILSPNSYSLWCSG